MKMRHAWIIAVVMLTASVAVAEERERHGNWIVVVRTDKFTDQKRAAAGVESETKQCESDKKQNLLVHCLIAHRSSIFFDGSTSIWLDWDPGCPMKGFRQPLSALDTGDRLQSVHIRVGKEKMQRHTYLWRGTWVQSVMSMKKWTMQQHEPVPTIPHPLDEMIKSDKPRMLLIRALPEDIVAEFDITGAREAIGKVLKVCGALRKGNQ